MVYMERTPHPQLAPFVKSFWYARNPGAAHGLERVLPAGHMQVVISLARDYLTDCSGGLSSCDGAAQRSPAALLNGMRSRFEMIDRFDMEELIGVIFLPGGTMMFFPGNASAFAGVDTDLESVWGRSAEQLRDSLREVPDVNVKFDLLEGEFLRRLMRHRLKEQPAAVSLALAAMHRQENRVTISEIVTQTGLSARRFTEIFRERVGLSPKMYQRVLRFQRAVQELHRETDVRWMELALECGYYDQSHFVNDFREFSGINPTTYTATPRIWSNHLPVG